MYTVNLWRSGVTTQPIRQPQSALPTRPQRRLLKMVVLNTKGGCGKTTLSTNLAGYYASRDYRTALLDADPQGSSLRWLHNRGHRLASINGIAGCDRSGRVTRSFQLRIPPETERLVVDTPAALDRLRIQDLTRGADAILIPVLPSDIDIHAATRCIAELLLSAGIEKRSERVAVVANRVKRNTRAYDTLRRFLHSLDIPFVATFRETQNYPYASEHGLSMHELTIPNARQDRHEWENLIGWLESRQPGQAELQPLHNQSQSAG